MARKQEGPQENLLVVEGTSDFFVLKGLLEARKLTGSFRYYEEAGYEQLRDALDTRLDESGLKRFGIVVDADDNLLARWNSLRDILTGPLCRYNPALFPTTPIPNGTVIFQEARPTLGIWIMPNNQDTGALEKFLAAMVKRDDMLWEYAAQCTTALPPQEWHSENWMNKATLYTWLAWQQEPGYPLGLAVRFCLDPHAEAAEVFIEWLRRLFDLASEP